jgi:hypothetical protein
MENIMRRPLGRLALGLLAAGTFSLLAGLAFAQAIALVPCRGEGLPCKIDEAIGGYAVIIWAILGPVIFGVTLSIARNRIALAGAMALLLVPLVAFFLITRIEHTLYLGFEPERQFRTFLVAFAPAALTVLVQYLMLRLVVPQAHTQSQ